MWKHYRAYVSYLSVVFGALIIILGIYDTHSWEDLRANFLGFIVGFGLIYVYSKGIKSQKNDK